MANIALSAFIGAHRDELIRRCRAKAAQRSAPAPAETEVDRGVPLFLQQLCKELSQRSSATREISQSALEHGRNLHGRGCTIAQVVHDYGDIRQSITELAVETNAAISTDDFRMLNGCLDDAIAGAVTQFARAQDVERNGKWSELWSLVNSVSAAFDVLQTGKVGVRGATGAVIRRSIVALRAFVDRRGAMPRVRPERQRSPAAADALGRAKNETQTKDRRTLPSRRADPSAAATPVSSRQPRASMRVK